MNAKASVNKYSNALFPDQESSEQQQDKSTTNIISKLDFFEQHEAIAKKTDEIITSDTDSDLVAEEESQESDEEQFKIKNENELINLDNEDEDEQIFEKKFEPLIEKKIEPVIEKKIEPFFNKQQLVNDDKKLDFMNADDEYEDDEEDKNEDKQIIEKTIVVQKKLEPVIKLIDKQDEIKKIIAEPKVTSEFIQTKTEYKTVIISSRKPFGGKKVRSNSIFV